MNDDQVITLLRETPLPADPPDRYASVSGRRRIADKRRTTVLAAALGVVTVAGAATALTWTTTPTAGPQSFLTSTTEAGTARISMHVKDGAGFDGGTGVVDFRHDAVELSFGAGTKKTTMRVIGKDTWVSGSSLTGMALPAGKHWLHLPPSGSMSTSFDMFNPADALERLRKEHADIKKLGTTTIDGVRVTDYRVVDRSGHAGSDVNAVRSDTGHVYLDSNGLMRRLATDDGAFTLDFTDFGIPVDLRPPLATDVAEFNPGDIASRWPTTMGSNMTPAQKRQACDTVRKAVESDTRMTAAQKQQVLKPFCG